MGEVYELAKVIIKPHEFSYQLTRYDSNRVYAGSAIADSLKDLAEKCLVNGIKIDEKEGKITTIDCPFIDIETRKSFDSVCLEEIVHFYRTYLDVEKYSKSLV